MNDCFESVRLIQQYYICTGIFQMGFSITYKLVFSPNWSCYLTFMPRVLYTGKILVPNLTSHTIMALMSRTSLTAFELINQLLYINFPSFERKVFRKIWSLRCRRLLHCDFVTSVIARLQIHNATDDGNVDFRSFTKILYSKLGLFLFSATNRRHGDVSSKWRHQLWNSFVLIGIDFIFGVVCV